MANSPTYVLHLIAAALLSHNFTRHIYFTSIIYLYRFYTRIVYAQGIYIYTYIYIIYIYISLCRTHTSHVSSRLPFNSGWGLWELKTPKKTIKQLDDNTQAYWGKARGGSAPSATQKLFLLLCVLLALFATAFSRLSSAVVCLFYVF